MRRVQIPYKLLLGDAWRKSFAMPRYLHFAHARRSIKWHICFRDINSTYTHLMWIKCFKMHSYVRSVIANMVGNM